MTEHGDGRGREHMGDRMTPAEKRAFGELVREAYLASADVDEQVEEALRLGREEPLEHERAVGLVERVLGKLQERGEMPGEDARAAAERIVSERDAGGDG